MPTLEVNGATLHYIDVGQGPETIVFSHAMLLTHDMYRAQIEALSPHFRCIAYDHRGHGKSVKYEGRQIDLATWYDDAVALIGLLDAAPCHFVGLSLGGFVGMRIAARRPEILKTLTLIDTQSGPEHPASMRTFQLLTLATRLTGVNRLLATKVMPILFGKSFLSDPSRRSELAAWRKTLTSNKRRIYRAVTGMTERPDFTSQLKHITAPTLVIHGNEDKAIPIKRGMAMLAHIPDSRFVTIQKSGHCSTIEQPGAVTDAIASFLRKHP